MTREEAIDVLTLRKELHEETAEALDMVIEALKADTVEVVRCKDCKRYDKGENESCSWEMCKRTKASVSDTDFCSFGERSEE